MWVQRAVGGLLAQNVGSLAVIVSLRLSVLARNVSWKRPLFAGSGAAVCRPLHLTSQAELGPTVIRRCHVWENAAQHFTSLCRIVYAKYHVFSSVRRRTRAQGRRLYVAHVEHGNCRYRHNGSYLRFRFIAFIGFPFALP
jgi:hypothetical protein